MRTKDLSFQGKTINGLRLVRREGVYWIFICPECGSEGKANLWNIRHGKIHTCGCKWNTYRADLVGRQIGKWTVISYKGRSIWECRCECGKLGSPRSSALLSGESLSCSACGASRRGQNSTIPEVGNRYGRLLVLRPVKILGRRGRFWECRCDCGSITTVYGGVLRDGGTASCGCNQWPTGCKHWSYNPSLTPEMRAYNGLDRREFAKRISPKVFERDSWTCLRCCQEGRRLHAHHLLSWKDYPEHRMSASNVVTLCTACHSELHSRFQPQLPTPEDLFQFLVEAPSENQ